MQYQAIKRISKNKQRTCCDVYLQRHSLPFDPYKQTHSDDPSELTHCSVVELHTRIPFEHSSISTSQFVPFHPDLHVQAPVTSSQSTVFVTLHVHACEHCEPNVVLLHAGNCKRIKIIKDPCFTGMIKGALIFDSLANACCLILRVLFFQIIIYLCKSDHRLRSQYYMYK